MGSEQRSFKCPVSKGQAKDSMLLLLFPQMQKKETLLLEKGVCFCLECHQPRPLLHSQRKNWPVRSTGPLTMHQFTTTVINENETVFLNSEMWFLTEEQAGNHSAKSETKRQPTLAQRAARLTIYLEALSSSISILTWNLNMDERTARTTGPSRGCYFDARRDKGAKQTSSCSACGPCLH